MMMATKTVGLYVHIPFCVRKCNYCDFCSFCPTDAGWREEYIDRLCREIESYSDRGIMLDSIFFGGGTPSLLSASEFGRICASIRVSFEITAECEFTIEANPKTIDREKLSMYRSCGVNRLSMGLQSIHENELKILGRIHNFDEFLSSYSLAREYGIDNINIDLMYGIPEQSMDSFRKTLDAVCALSPQHISLYGLIIEEGTPFFRRGRVGLGLPADEDIADEEAISLWEQACALLREAGYEHYEISNFALKGFRSRHNLHTWQCHDYLGLGVAAHSCMDGVRFGQSRDMDGFLAGKDITEFTEVLTPEDRMAEFIMLGLRLSDGIDEAEFFSRFDVDFWHTYGSLCISFIEKGLMLRSEGRVRLTEAGFSVSNSILTELI